MQPGIWEEAHIMLKKQGSNGGYVLTVAYQIVLTQQEPQVSRHNRKRKRQNNYLNCALELGIGSK